MDLLINIITIYGPLSFGWVLAVALWFRSEKRETFLRERAEKREDLLREGLQNNTAAMNVLAERIATVLQRT